MIPKILPILLICSGIPSSWTISRSEVITRAEFWTTNGGVPYSQSNYFPDSEGEFYRTDCSCYVSMAWRLPSNESTWSLAKFSVKITKDELNSGDILLKEGSHVLIFDKWSSDAKTKYWAYEQANYTLVKRRTAHIQIPYPYWPNSPQGYVPYRFSEIDPTTQVPPSGKCECPSENPYAIGAGGSTDDYCADRMQGTCDPSSLFSCLFTKGQEPLLAINKPCPLGCETIPFGILIGSGKPYYKSRCALKPKPTSAPTIASPTGKCACPPDNPNQPFFDGPGGDGSAADYCGTRMNGNCNPNSLYVCIFTRGKESFINEETICNLGCETKNYRLTGDPYYISNCVAPPFGVPNDKTIYYPRVDDTNHSNQQFSSKVTMIMFFLIVTYYC